MTLANDHGSLTRVRRCKARRAMTLVEMLVAMAATLLLMSVIAQLFGILGKTVSDSSNVQALNARMRGVARMLGTDLAGCTAKTLPPLDSASDCGYFEIIEGQDKDYVAATPNLLVGDCDDVLMFTARNLGQPYLGKFGSNMFESQTAELAWFCRSAGNETLTGVPVSTLYRRQLLTTAYVGDSPFLPSNSVPATSWETFYSSFDLSCRVNNGRFYPNSLGDLTKRENRFLHSATFPHAFSGVETPGAYFRDTSPRRGDDVILKNVIAFDVKVYDPAAVVGSNPPGSYVDLNWGNASSPVATNATFPSAGGTAFQGMGVNCSSSGNAALALPTYDTWSTHYEFNGINEGDSPTLTSPPKTDEGSNALDDNNDGFVDDAGEQETSPPYPVALRGIEIRIRVYEPSSRQVRQVTVRHTFVPH
jgi:hypothetical protein